MEYDDAIPMYCHLVPGWDTENCCPSCHSDADYGYEATEVEIGGKVMPACCACAIWWDKNKSNA